MSIIDEEGGRRVRMATLAIVGSHSVNGGAALHTEILKRDVFREFHEMWPPRFNNKTNGITPRRWLLESNPPLAGLITGATGPGWRTDLEALRGPSTLAADPAFAARLLAAKRENQHRPA